MPRKPRIEPAELKNLRYLNTRMNFPEKEKQHYLNLKKGFEGEVKFDLLTENLQCECLILNDLLLKINNTIFQIDTLIILQEIIFMNEIKNYEGDFYYQSDKLYTKSKSEINNPLHQLNRSESLLRQLLQKLGFNFPIEAWVVFINPEFTLYQAPLDQPIIFPTQVNRYLKRIDTMPSKLTGKHKNLADKLISLHIEESPFTRLQAYDYNQLRKGITCAACNSFSISVVGKNCVCLECGHEEVVEAAVMRSVGEFKLLFPDKKITTKAIFEWCMVVDSKKRISRILERNFKVVGVHRWAFYE